jgi:Putative Flp pilus-assembly TadE/G-like
MPRVRIRLFGRRRDAGGVAVTVGILLSTGVLLGMSALVVDVGQLYVEREELQSAADAAAVAVAVDCLRAREDECGNSSDAQDYADLNSSDGASKVEEVCGEVRMGSDVRPGWLPSCSVPAAENLTACIGGLPENTQGWVQVSTRTERPTGDASTRFILPPVFAETLSNTNRGTAVGACSRVAWGTPDSSFALTVCENLFNDVTNDALDLLPAPPASVSRSLDQRLLFRPGPYSGLCDDSNPTTVYANGRWPLKSDFGWTDIDDATSCDVDLSHSDVDPSRSDIAQSTPAEPSSTPDACKDRLDDALNSRRPVAVLVVRQTSVDQFEVRGVAAFVVTGYRIQSSTWTGRRCGSRSDTELVCIRGYFTAALIPDEKLMPSSTSPYGQFGAAPTLGASVMQTVG